MFIERSSARIRLARTLFIVLGLVPCAGLCGWAMERQSAWHRTALERRFGLVLGIPVHIGRVEHVRPDALRLRDCTVALPESAAALRFPVVDVEWSADELRVGVERFAADPTSVRAIAGLARDWLRQPARFPLDCVVDVGECLWRGHPLAAGTAGPSAALRVECVAAHGARAVRVRRGVVADGDEVRMVATGGTGVPVVAVTGRITGPLPLPLVLAAAGGDAVAVGDDALLSGEFDAALENGRSRGRAHGLVEGIDLAVAAAGTPSRMGGVAAVRIERLAWDGGRIGGFEATCSIDHGRVSQRLLDTLVATLGCRPGPAFRALDRDDSRLLDDVRARMRIDGRGVELRAVPGRDGSLARVQGLSIVDEPTGIIPLDRLAWAIAPPSTPAVPATATSVWLLDAFSAGDGADSAAIDRGGQALRPPPTQAGRPQPRSGF